MNESGRVGKSNERIARNLKDVLELLEQQVNGYSNPATADVQTVYNLMQQRIKVDNVSVDLTPQQQLQALDNLESWYKERGAAYPYPSRLKEQKEFWSKRISDKLD